MESELVENMFNDVHVDNSLIFYNSNVSADDLDENSDEYDNMLNESANVPIDPSNESNGAYQRSTKCN